MKDVYCNRPGCLGMHCMFPGHEWFCLPKYVNFPYVLGGRFYCKKHYEHADGSELSPETRAKLTPIRSWERPHRRKFEK
jgi:hypothetical protein